MKALVMVTVALLAIGGGVGIWWWAMVRPERSAAPGLASAGADAEPRERAIAARRDEALAEPAQTGAPDETQQRLDRQKLALALGSLGAELEAMKRQAGELQEAIARQDQRAEGHQARLEAHQGRLDEQARRADDQQSRLDALSAAVQEHDRTIEEARQQREHLQAELDAAGAEHQRLDQQIAALEAAAQGADQAHDERLTALEREIDQARGERERQRQHGLRLEGEVQRMSATIERLESLLQEVRRMLGVETGSGE